MSQQIDSTGTYLGTIEESGLSTSKGGFPQAILRLKATQKYINAPNELAHFKLEEPAYVDWSGFDEDILAYLILFKSTEEFTKDTALLNYEQLQLATGWDGQSFEPLADGKSLLGKTILFRVEENTYEGKTSLRVQWVDAADAPPEKSIKSLDVTAAKALSAKLRVDRPAPKPQAAKPGKPGKPSPANAPTPAVSSATPKVTPPATAPKSPSKPPTKKAAAEVPAEASVPAIGLPTAVSQEEAWNYVNAHKGENSDGEIADAWLSATGEVGPNRDDTDFTKEDWAKVRDIVVKDMDLK